MQDLKFLSNWIISEDNNKNKIIERNDASRGSFLSGIDDNVNYEGKFIFYLNLNYNAEVVMSVSYAQNEKWKNDEIELSFIYSFIIDKKKFWRRHFEIKGRYNKMANY